jgi:hypothetical protein
MKNQGENRGYKEEKVFKDNREEYKAGKKEEREGIKLKKDM